MKPSHTTQSEPATRLRILRTGAWMMATLIILATGRAHAAAYYKGFHVSNAIIPLAAILTGGPPRDGIPSIDQPRFLDPGRVNYLRPNDMVVSFTAEGETRAYPLRILVWHEIVNDRIAGIPIAVTYCPLCGTAMIFDRRHGEGVFTFGVSGLLYQSDVLMYDRETETLWSQLGMKAVAGALVGEELSWLPSEHLTWRAWRDRYPDGRVLSTVTGYRRDYGKSPYDGYEQRETTMFPVPEYRRDLLKKEWVVGIVINGEAAAFPIRTLDAHPAIEESLGGVDLRVEYDSDSQSVRVVNVARGEYIPSVKVYWFAWQAFYPQTRLWEAPAP